MGASVTPDVGALVLSGFAPTTFAVRQQGSSHFLLVLANPDAFTPYDPSSTGLPGDEHIYFTTRRRADHPWIAEQTPGDPTSGPDISIGGQRLQLPLGRSVDGECQVRIIDAPGPVPVCGLSVVTPEGDADLNLGANSFVAGPDMWHSHEELASDGVHDDFVPHGGHFVSILGGKPGFAGFIIFGSDTYDGYIWRVFDGTQGGGPGFTPGQRYGFRCRVSWGLDTGPGNLYIETIGGTDPVTGLTVNRVSFPDGTYDFWNVDPTLSTIVFNGYVSAIADSSGEIEFRFGAEGYGGSCNVTATLDDMEIVTCGETVPVDADRYYTAQLTDDDARQRTLGWPYYLKLSEDGGLTFTSMVYAGYHKQSTMERSLTFLVTGGDAGRGRRVSKAWAGLDPVEDFT